MAHALLIASAMKLLFVSIALVITAVLAFGARLVEPEEPGLPTRAVEQPPRATAWVHPPVERRFAHDEEEHEPFEEEDEEQR